MSFKELEDRKWRLIGPYFLKQSQILGSQLFVIFAKIEQRINEVKIILLNPFSLKNRIMGK